MSIARLAPPSRLELKSLAGSLNAAPLAKVSFTVDLYDSPVQMMPSWDHTGTPAIAFDGFLHFTSSTTFGSASLISLRILLKVAPRQSPRSAILSSTASEADAPSAEPDFFMVSSYDLPQPGIAAACFTHLAISASSRSSSWMSIQRASLPVPPGGTGRSDVPRKKATLT